LTPCSNSYTGYKLTEKARTVLAGDKSAGIASPRDQKVILNLPSDIFEGIIGYYFRAS
jgi:hypothetical protein